MTADAASLLDVDPLLRRVLGPRHSATLGRQPILPVLAIVAGEWTPPTADVLRVLDGLLLCVSETSRRAVGPGDPVGRWAAERRWTACTPVRLAVLGPVFVQALDRWPWAGAAVLEAAEASPIALLGPLDERLVTLLWQLARRFGTLRDGGIALPLEFGARTLGILTGDPEHDIEFALTGLEDGDAVHRGRTGAGHLPGSDGQLALPDELRARVAEQFARARLSFSDFAAVSDALEDERRRRASGRAGLGGVAADADEAVEP